MRARNHLHCLCAFEKSDLEGSGPLSGHDEVLHVYEGVCTMSALKSCNECVSPAEETQWGRCLRGYGHPLSLSPSFKIQGLLFLCFSL
jgi:hypothetical protein